MRGDFVKRSTGFGMKPLAMTESGQNLRRLVSVRPIPGLVPAAEAPMEQRAHLEAGAVYLRLITLAVFAPIA